VAYFFERCYGAAGAIFPKMLPVGIYFFGYLMRCLFKCEYRNFWSIPAARAFLGRFPAQLFSRASLGNDFPNWILTYCRPSLARV
jgi:hypothetical protein